MTGGGVLPDRQGRVRPGPPAVHAKPSMPRSHEGSRCGEHDVIPLSVPEIRRFIGRVIVPPLCLSNERRLHCSRYRRTSQARASRCHYRRRGHTPQMGLQ